MYIHRPGYLSSGGDAPLSSAKKPWALFLSLMFYTHLSPAGGADSRGPFQLTNALREPSAASKVQMESCQQRDSFRSDYRMIHPWHEDRPGDGPTTLTAIGEPGQEHRCPLLGSAGTGQVRECREPHNLAFLLNHRELIKNTCRNG